VWSLTKIIGKSSTASRLGIVIDIRSPLLSFVATAVDDKQ
jgi:hypothetical protein